MPDLLTHVLVGYVAATLLRRRTTWFRAGYTPLLMAGSALPDLSKVRLVLTNTLVSETLGVPFSWTGIHRLGPMLALAGVGALLVERQHRRPAFGLLLGGSLVHLLLDAGIDRADGLAPPYLYPFTWWQPPAGGLYVSSDPWPLAVALVAATVTLAWDRYLAG